jgi:hypothetical protein
MCTSRAWSLSTGTEPRPRRTPSHLRHSTTSHSLSHSRKSTPHRCHLHLPRPAATWAPQLRHPEPLGSQAPQSRSQKAPRPEVRARVSRAVTPATAVGSHPEVQADQ